MPKPRPKATQPSQSAFHAYTGERHSRFQVTLTYQEVHLLNRVREMVAETFEIATSYCKAGELPSVHKRLEAMDVLCDQLGLEDLPARQRARECGARDPFGPEEVEKFIGAQPSTTTKREAA